MSAGIFTSRHADPYLVRAQQFDGTLQNAEEIRNWLHADNFEARIIELTTLLIGRHRIEVLPDEWVVKNGFTIWVMSSRHFQERFTEVQVMS